MIKNDQLFLIAKQNGKNLKHNVSYLIEFNNTNVVRSQEVALFSIENDVHSLLDDIKRCKKTLRNLSDIIKREEILDRKIRELTSNFSAGRNIALSLFLLKMNSVVNYDKLDISLSLSEYKRHPLFG